jgi:hypothetical protein
LKLVPAAGVEIMCVVSNAVLRCAFVGPMRNGSILPVLVVQCLGSSAPDMAAVREKLRTVIETSVWSELLNAGICLVAYPMLWPVDERHSSKCNRFFLRDWASKLASNRLIVI